MTDESKPWKKHLRNPEDDFSADEVSSRPQKDENGKDKSAEGRKKRVVSKKGEGEFYRDLEGYLDEQYEKVLAPMRESLANRQIQVIQRDSVWGRAEKTSVHTGSSGTDLQMKEELSKDEFSGNQNVPEEDKSSLCVKMIQSNDLSSVKMTQSDDLLCVKMTQSDDVRDGPIVAPSVKMKGDISSLCVKMTRDTSSPGVILNNEIVAPSVIKTSRGQGVKPSAGKARTASPRGQVSMRMLPGIVDRVMLKKAIAEEKRQGRKISASCEQVIWFLADMADKNGSRKVPFVMSGLISEMGFSISTGHRVQDRINEFPSVFERAKGERGRGTYVIFKKSLWIEKSPDREIDKNKRLFSFLPGPLKFDEIRHIEFLFFLHLSGLSISSGSFSLDKERFLLRYLKMVRERIVLDKPYIGDRQLIDEMYAEGAEQLVSLWHFICTQTAKEISRPLAYFISCWEKTGENGVKGGDILDRITPEDMEWGKNFVRCLRHVTDLTLDDPDMESLRRIGTIVLKRDCSDDTRDELTESIRKKSTEIVTEILGVWKFVQKVSAEIFFMSGRKGKGKKTKSGGEIPDAVETETLVLDMNSEEPELKDGSSAG